MKHLFLLCKLRGKRLSHNYCDHYILTNMRSVTYNMICHTKYLNFVGNVYIYITFAIFSARIKKKKKTALEVV